MSSTRIFTLGNGFIANELSFQKISERIYPNQKEIKLLFDYYKPDVLVNCIGYCGIKNIDDCVNNKEKTITSNTIIPTLLALEANKRGIHFINIGSGCIFSGQSPNVKKTNNKCYYLTNDSGWTEEDIPNPVSFYSETKVATDYAIQQLDNVCTLRIRMPISASDNSRNFINKIKNYSKLIDIHNSVTFTEDLTNCVNFMIEHKKTGTYNVVNNGTLTATEVMREYQKYFPEHKFEIITESELDKIVSSRRSNCILSNRKLQDEGFVFRDAKDALQFTMKRYVDNIKNEEQPL